MDDKFKIRAWDVIKKEMIFDGNNSDTWIGREQIVLMQCSGFRDKNGILIWENDICKCFNCFYRVRYFEEAWHLGDNCLLYEKLPDLEVVGNIYENLLDL